jgi:chlorophyll synthase
MIRSVLTLVRWSDWGASKIPPLFAVGYTWLLQEPSLAQRANVRFTVWIAFTVLLMAFGYGVNDLADRSVDKVAGKPRPIASWSSVRAVTWLVAFPLIGLLMLYPFRRDPGVALFAGVSCFAAAAYSLPPLRFKERGVAGLVVPAFAQRSLPLLVGMALLRQLANPTAWLAVLVFTLVGLRWILLHQTIDLANDERAGVRTFVRDHGLERTRSMLKNVIFPVELVLLIVWLTAVAVDVPVLSLALPGYVAWFLAKAFLWQGVSSPLGWTSYRLHPLADFYEIFLPLLAGTILAAWKPHCLPLFVLQLTVQGAHLRSQLVGVRKLLARRLRPSAARVP